MRSIYYYIRLGRPLFLVGGFLFYGLGVVLALLIGEPLNLPALFWGQVAVTATQLMTHYSNEYFDLAADKVNPHPTRWAGGSRVLAQDRLPPSVALATAVIMGILALVATFWLALVVKTGPLTFPLILLSMLLAWGYSAPPLRLHSRGLGELTVAILVPGLTPLIGFYLQAGRLGILPLLASLPLCCIQFAMLLAVNFPDAAGDVTVGKRTLVVRWGGARCARLYAAALLAAFVLLPLLVLAGLPQIAALAILLFLPLALWQSWRVLRGAWQNPARWDSVAFWTIGLLIPIAAAEFLAITYLLLS